MSIHATCHVWEGFPSMVDPVFVILQNLSGPNRERQRSVYLYLCICLCICICIFVFVYLSLAVYLYLEPVRAKQGETEVCVRSKGFRIPSFFLLLRVRLVKVNLEEKRKSLDGAQNRTGTKGGQFSREVLEIS